METIRTDQLLKPRHAKKSSEVNLVVCSKEVSDQAKGAHELPLPPVNPAIGAIKIPFPIFDSPFKHEKIVV